MNLIVLTVLTLVLTQPLSNTELLIQKLDSENYTDRVAAYQALEQMDVDAIPDLERHLSDKNREIRRSCNDLLTSILNVDMDGDVEYPDIRFLPDELKYCMGDITTSYIKAAKEEMSIGVHKVWVAAMGFYITVPSEYAVEVMTGKLATRMYMADLRYGGASRKEAAEILDKMVLLRHMEWNRAYIIPLTRPSPYYGMEP